MLKALRKWLLRVLSSPVPLTASGHQALEDVPFRSTSSIVPYDESLLERSRTQWQFGDWESLAKLERDTLQHHPDRAKLALLAAAGHIQQGNSQAARLFTRLAQEWGCSKKLISQILISGVHNSLARAATVAGRQTRSLHHFDAAIAIGNQGSDQRLLAQARINEQRIQLGLEANRINEFVVINETKVIAPLAISPPSPGLEELGQTLKEQKSDLDNQLKKQANDLISVRKFLDSSLKKEVANATKQMEAAVGLQSYFATGELPNINIERHSWPISPDFSLYLIELLETNDYDLIIEFGSGISTVILAKTLAKMAVRRGGKESVALISFEHLEKYYNQTQARLRQADLADKVQLELASLEPYTSPNGNTYPYYSCHKSLATLAQKHRKADAHVLVLIDGPPAATGKHARYPAAPSVMKYFKGANVSFLLDDYIRDDEKEIVALWEAEFSAQGLVHNTTLRSLEKDACLIMVSAETKQPVSVS
jgi:hypothetical protein